MYEAFSFFWYFINTLVYFVGMCSFAIFLFKFSPIYFNQFYKRLSKWKIYIGEQKQKIITNVGRVYLSSTFFMAVLMHHMPGPERFERYYVFPNVFCVFWVMACYRYVRVAFSREWKPVRVLPKMKRIQNYILWLIMCGAFLFLFRNYLLEPVPYYITFPLLAILTTYLLMSRRNPKRSGREAVVLRLK